MAAFATDVRQLGVVRLERGPHDGGARVVLFQVLDGVERQLTVALVIIEPNGVADNALGIELTKRRVLGVDQRLKGFGVPGLLPYVELILVAIVASR